MVIREIEVGSAKTEVCEVVISINQLKLQGACEGLMLPNI